MTDQSPKPDSFDTACNFSIRIHRFLGTEHWQKYIIGFYLDIQRVKEVIIIRLLNPLPLILSTKNMKSPETMRYLEESIIARPEFCCGRIIGGNMQKTIVEN